MMTINSVSMNRSISYVPSGTSSMESKALQSELTGKQQQLKTISSNREMPTRDKERERREIQREIAELNRKLKQELIAEKEEIKETAKAQEKRKVIKEELLEQATNDDKTDSNEDSAKSNADKTGSDSTPKNIPVVTLKNVLVASSIVQQEEVQQHALEQTDAQKDILEAEINSDTLYATDTSAKKEALSNLRRKAPIKIAVINQQADQITPSMNFDSKIIIREEK